MRKIAGLGLAMVALGLGGCRARGSAAGAAGPGADGGAASAPAQVSAVPVAAAGVDAQAEAATVPLKSFREGPVSFEYPTVWTRSAIAGGYLPTMIPQGKPAVTVSFSSKGNYYAGTNLSGLQFSYEAVKAESAAACKALVAKSGDVTKTSSATVAGVVYDQFAGSDAGMCHDRSATADATFRDGTCYLFERDFDTICTGVKPGERALTANETKALQRHLDDVFESVRLR